MELTGTGAPKPKKTVLIGRRQVLALGREGEGPGSLGGSGESAFFLARGGVEQANSGVGFLAAGRGQELAVGKESDGVDVTVMPRQLTAHLPAGRFVQVDRVVPFTGRQGLAVRGEG